MQIIGKNIVKLCLAAGMKNIASGEPTIQVPQFSLR